MPSSRKPDGRFVIVRENLWTDSKFLALGNDARLLFMWSWMPPHANLSGLYRSSLPHLESAIGESSAPSQFGAGERLQYALDELRRERMLLFDFDHELVWVVNKVKYAATSPKAIALMQREFRAAPASPLADLFVARWGKHLRLGE